MIKAMLRIVAVTLLCCMVFTTAVSAESYTYNYKIEPVQTPEAVSVKRYVDAAYAGGGTLNKPEDMDIAANGDVWIADTGNNRIVLLDKQYRFVRDFRTFEMPDGSVTEILQPMGIYAAPSNRLYVADSGNGRVLVLDEQMRVLQEIRASSEEVYKEDFLFKPLKMASDQAGRTYVIADGVYDGLMEFDPSGKFIGFSGTSKVTPNVVDLFWNWFGTEAQRKQRLKNIPTEFNNLDMDAEGFVFTVTTSVDQYNPAKSEPVRKQTAKGSNILRFNEIWGRPVGDLVFPSDTDDAKIIGPSMLSDISANEAYGYACLDKSRGRVFVYNNDGEMMFAFGGLGSAKGMFALPSAVVCSGDEIAVLDKDLGTITVFEYSEYAQRIIRAQDDYLNGRYEEAKEGWMDVLRLNSGLDMAYTGLGKIYIREGNYELAKEYLKIGGNKTYYSIAYKEYRADFLEEHFTWFIGGLALLILLLSLYVKYWRPKLKQKQGLNRYTWYRGFKYGFYTMVHPFDGFWDMTHEKRGNMASAGILYGLFVLTFIIRASCTGFLFSPLDNDFNILMVIASAVLPVCLWCICNWSVTTLFDGDGKLSEIFMATGYALLPYSLINIPVAILSNFLTAEEGMLLNILTGASLLWCAFLLFAAMLTIHNYTPKQTMGTITVTLVGMVVVVFLAVLFFSLIQQLLSFVISMYTEVTVQL